MVEVTAFFIARRNATRRSSWSATFSATSCASSSAFRISLMLMKISLVRGEPGLRPQAPDLGARRSGSPDAPCGCSTTFSGAIDHDLRDPRVEQRFLMNFEARDLVQQLE
jgi:hypothetical protein